MLVYCNGLYLSIFNETRGIRAKAQDQRCRLVLMGLTDLCYIFRGHSNWVSKYGRKISLTEHKLEPLYCQTHEAKWKSGIQRMTSIFSNKNKQKGGIPLFSSLAFYSFFDPQSSIWCLSVALSYLLTIARTLIQSVQTGMHHLKG